MSTAAKAPDRAISASLSSFAAAMIAGTLFIAGSFADKVQWWALAGGFVLACLGIIALIASIVVGAHGSAYGTTTGAGNAFDRQAWFGLVGLILLLLSSAVFVFGPRAETAFEKRLDSLQTKLDGLEGRVSALQKQSSASPPVRAPQQGAKATSTTPQKKAETPPTAARSSK